MFTQPVNNVAGVWPRSVSFLPPGISHYILLLMSHGTPVVFLCCFPAHSWLSAHFVLIIFWLSKLKDIWLRLHIWKKDFKVGRDWKVQAVSPFSSLIFLYHLLLITPSDKDLTFQRNLFHHLTALTLKISTLDEKEFQQILLWEDIWTPYNLSCFPKLVSISLLKYGSHNRCHRLLWSSNQHNYLVFF